MSNEDRFEKAKSNDNHCLLSAQRLRRQKHQWPLHTSSCAYIIASQGIATSRVLVGQIETPPKAPQRLPQHFLATSLSDILPIVGERHADFTPKRLFSG